MWEYFHIFTPLQCASASMHTRALMFTDTQMQNKQHHLQSDKTINPGQYAASIFGGKKSFKKFDNNSHKYKHPSHSLDQLISVHLLVKKKSVVKHGPSTNVHLLFSLWSEIVTTARLFR